MAIIAVLTTVDSRELAQVIATTLVERKLAACVQVTPVESFYTWHGQAQQDAEFRVMAKTLASRYPEVEAAIRELHTYELPAIYALPIREIFPPYAEWISKNVTPGSE